MNASEATGCGTDTQRAIENLFEIPGSGAGTYQYALNVISASGPSTETHANINLNVEVVRP